MSLLDANADELMTGAIAAPPTAPKKQEPKFSLWSTLAAAPKGLAAGASEAVGSTADILGAYGSVMGAVDGRAGGMFSLPTQKEQADQNKANEALLKNGPDYMTGAGRNFRNAAADYMPDALTAHGAEVVVGDLFRMGGKAIGAAATLGPIPGAILAGVEEGFTTSDKLAGQGVDLATRTKVGGVTAAVNAAGFALPVAGKTIAATAGLAMLGGPVSFMTQQAATREILRNADYTKLAETYDPFDPVGLTLSTILPLGFGAMAMRGAKARAKADVPAVEPAPEHVDAARVNLLRENMDKTNPLPDDMSGAHADAYGKAIDQMANGERVSVADGLPPEGMAFASESMAARLADIGKEMERVPEISAWMAERGIEPMQVPTAAPDAKGNAFISWIKGQGGIAYSQKNDIVGEAGFRGNYAGIFTKTGQQLDTLVESAVQHGYLSRAEVDSANDNGGTRALAELIRRATTGEKVMRAEDVQAARLADGKARADAEAVAQMEKELQTLGVDPSAAKGNPEALAAYLSDHREALVNSRLSVIDAETRSARAQTGEAFGLTPKQTDQQSRIALASELNESAVERAAMQSIDEVDFLNRIEEILRNEPRSQKDAGSQPSPAQNARVSAGDATQTTGRANPAGPTRFDFNALATEAARLLSDGRSPAEIIGQGKAAGQALSPELNNALIAVQEFGKRLPELINQFRAVESAKPNAKPMDLIADTVDRMRAGAPVEKATQASPTDAAIESLKVGKPTALDVAIPVEFDANGKPTRSVSAAEFLDTIKREAAQEADDARLLEVAANCFISTGAG